MKRVKSAEARIVRGEIMIRLPIENIDMAVEGGISAGYIDPGFKIKITNAEAFAKDIVQTLNEEDESGYSRIHRMFDEAFADAIDDGAEGWEEVEDDGEA